MRKLVKSVLAAVLTASVVISLPAVAYADGDDAEAVKKKSYETAPDTDSLRGWPEGPKVYAGAAIIMDMDSGAILYGKNIDEKRYPASITKLLTALVAVENSGFEDEIVFSDDSISFLEYDDAHIGMKPGEILSMKDALYGLLLASANEVAYAIAENVGEKMGGGYDTFIQAMNDRAAELGCTGSHWTNANGLHDENHYTTAHDMALIAAEVSEHQELLDIMQTLNYTIGTTNLVDETRTFQQHHKMLWQENSNYYEYCIGGKTGYTDDAGTTLVTMADNGQMRLAAVVLYDYGTDAYVDTRAMFDYTYSNFSKISLLEQEKPDEIRSYTDTEAYVVLPAGISYEDLEMEIAVLDEKEGAGKVTYLYQGQNVGSTEVTLTPEYVQSATGYTTRLQINEKSAEFGKDIRADEGIPLWGRILIGAGAAAAVLAVLLILAILRHKRKKLRIRRRRQQMLAERRRRERRRTHDRQRRYEL